ncbi:MAG: choice-of-anchor Q domain-containing protein [Chloroflexaceae bacterium]
MSSRRSFSPMLRLFFLLLFALVSASPTVVAIRPALAQATLVVTRATDTDDGVCDSDCSLREAIADATAGAMITFAAGVDRVTLTIDELRISTSLTIDGGSGVTIERDSGAGNFRIFTISGAGVEVTLDSLTIRNGRVTGAGGGIFNSDATLTISNSTVSGNRTDDGAGGGTSGRAGGDGGGIFNTGNLTISNSTVGSNRAGNGGSGSIFDGAGGGGGGIYNRGIVTISNSTVSDNQTGSGSRGGAGGGIMNVTGILTIRDSTISGNQTGSGGFAGDGGGIWNGSAGIVTITSSTISDNQTGGGGNFAGDGGGIQNESDGRLIISNSTISGNRAGNGGNGSSFGGRGGAGGGIANTETVIISNSTISGNRAGNGGNGSSFGGIGGSGGGIFNFGNSASAGTVTIINSTLNGNQSGSGGSPNGQGRGGAGGGIFNSNSGTVRIANTIVANSPTGGDIVDEGDVFINSGNSIVEDGSLVGTLTGDPQLGPLQDNGGPTRTHLPQTGSPAIDGGSNALVDGSLPLADLNGDGVINGNDILNSEQRGFDRVVNGTVDIGAVEVGAGNIAYSIAVDSSSITEGRPNQNSVLVTVARVGGTADAGSIELAPGGTAVAGDDYTLALDSSGTSFDAGTGVLTFEAGTPQATFALSAQTDGLIEPDETVTLTLANPTAPEAATISAPATVEVTILNADTAGATLNPANLMVSEAGSSASYTLVLTSRPTADVTISIMPDAQLNTDTPTLTFTPATWDTPQVVTVTALDDAVVEGIHIGSISHSATSSDSNFDGITIADMTVTVQDNDGANVTIMSTSLSVSESGMIDSYTVVLTSRPSADVTVNIAPDAQLGIDAATLTFTPATWDTPQAVTVTAVDDAVAEGMHSGVISHSATSSDSNYNGITIMDATVMVQDNDGANVLINPTSLSVSARGITAGYTVVLTSRPTADVTIVIVPDAQLRANGPILTFTPATWDTPQVVTVAALDTTAAAGTRGGMVSHIAVSSDSDYNGIDIMDVTVTVQGDVEGGELSDTTIVYLPLIVR